MVSTFGTYKRVLMVGFDGMGAFNKYANTVPAIIILAVGVVVSIVKIIMSA